MYYLMHENSKLAAFNVDEENILNLSINPNTTAFLPIGRKTENDIRKWIRERGLPVTRKNINRELASLGNITPLHLMLANCGLSLTDHYWIVDAKKLNELTWETVNCYDNNFRSTLSIDLTDDIRIKDLSNKTNFIPSTSLKGDLQKKWIIDENNIRWLVKGNYDNTGRQSVSEVLASLIHQMQGWSNYTNYEFVNLTHNKNKILGSMCQDFTNINTEFIPAADIVSLDKKPNDMSYYEFYIKLCEYHGILNARLFMEYQILTDFVITNTDRHLNNFGIIRDSKSLQWLCCAPIFDNGNSMFYRENYIPIGKNLLKIQVNSFTKKEVDLLKYVTNRGLLDIYKLPNEDTVMSVLAKDKYTSKETNERIIKAYKKKIQYLYDYQNGANIWAYNYKG